ncbi:MAG: GAF domain-containing protein [Thiolinea sp.]
MRTHISRTLKQRREAAEQGWRSFLADLKKQQAVTVRQEICDSWLRSREYLQSSADQKPPLDDPYETRFLWQESPIREVAQRELGQLMEMVSESNCVAAISDVSGRLLWTYASPHMEVRAADEHFIAGGRWGEQNSGTNAIGLTLQTRKPVTVFSAEHYKPSLHEWVCYAAPIISPENRELIGVLDLSSTWEQHNPMAQAAVYGMSQSIAARLGGHLAYRQPGAELDIRLLGGINISYRNQPVRLSLRHCEILCLLALHPQGMTLDALHAALYGDLPVTKNTLKSEISTLRSLLHGRIASRPYRLMLDFKADFIELWSALKHQQLEKSLQLYRGSLLPESASPEIEQWRYCIEAVVNRTVEGCNSLDTIMRQCDAGAGEMIRERLLSLAGG